jgi:hypothetical protein
MKTTARLLVLAAVAASFATVSPASANDCSDPKRPCGGCSVNLDATEVTQIVRCYPT